MRATTNLLWPETPFGSVTRPVQKSGAWLTGVSLLWGEAGDEPVLMGAAAVFMKIHRTRPLPFSVPLANFGYHVLTPDGIGQTVQIVDQLDALLVQARRQAQIIAWHNGADDLHVLQQLPRAHDAPRHAGVNAVAQGWKNRSAGDASTACCVDTSHDLGPSGLISDTATAHGLEPLTSLAGGRQQTSAQLLCDALTDRRGKDFHPEHLIVSALSSALTTALLGGKHARRLHWEAPVSIHNTLERVAWQAAPSLLGGVAPVRSQ